MKFFKTILLFNAISVLIICSCTQKEQADLIVYNATVYTCDSVFSVTESFAVKDGKIIETGSSDHILKKYKSEEKIDANGKFIYPGFYDAHCHFLGYGMNKETYCDLSDCTSPEDAVTLLSDFSSKHKSSWILGRGWNQNNWPGGQFPNKDLLDKHFPQVPVYLVRVDGHAAWVNSTAMNIAGIDEKTQIEGGKILLTEGQTNGILIDEAMNLVKAHIPLPTEQTKIKALTTAQEDCFHYGITSVGDAGLTVKEVLLVDSLHKAGKLQIRIYAMLEPGCPDFEEFVKSGILVNEKLSVRSIKMYADGALGSRGACLLDDYSDDPGNKGVMVNSYDHIYNMAQKAHKHGWQLCVHAIGDSANRQVLQIYAEILGGPNDKRWRIEHAQVIHPDDFHLFGDFNIIPSIQTTHATSDMYWAGKRLGEERMKTAYAYKDLLKQNGWLCNGTDFPVEQLNPFYTFYSAISRKDNSGLPSNGFQSENALTREETLLSMTIWAAKAAFEESIKGSIEKGKVADFIITELDLMKIDEKWIPEMDVWATYVDGKCVYAK
jgi:predicted amidohydrolase YtcJ